MSTRIYIFLFIITFISGHSINGYACDNYGVEIADPSLYQPGRYYDGTNWSDCEEHFFCTGDGMERCCPENFPNSTPGTADIENCYTPCATGSDNYDTHTEDCGLAYGNHVFDSLSVSCIQNDILTMWITDEDYHIETLGDNNYGCYLNNRDCNKFDVSWQETYTGVTLETVTITGTAHWDNNNYNTDECSATAIFNDQRQLINCKTKRFCPVSSSTVANATTSIQYNNRNATGAYYYCTECLSSGYYPTTIKPTPQQLHLPNCNNPDGGYKACSCAQIEIGYYGTCNWTSTQPLDVCSPTPCPTGKTTNTPQSTSIDDCHYGPDTQICDTGGCKNLGDFDAPENWINL